MHEIQARLVGLPGRELSCILNSLHVHNSGVTWETYERLSG